MLKKKQWSEPKLETLAIKMTAKFPKPGGNGPGPNDSYGSGSNGNSSGSSGFSS